MMKRKWLFGVLCGMVWIAFHAEYGRPLATMPLGDSITAGYFVGKGGYRNFLREELLRRGLRVDLIGQSTDRSDGIVDPEH